MKQPKIKLIQENDYKSIHRIDELTQIQYLGTKWENLTFKEKRANLVSRKEDFKIYVNSGFSLVAFVETNIVGFIFAYENSPFKNSVYVNHIAISPKFQGNGIGEMLYKKLIAIAKLKKINKIQALINTDNPNSISLHKKMEFTFRDKKEAIKILSK